MEHNPLSIGTGYALVRILAALGARRAAVRVRRTVDRENRRMWEAAERRVDARRRPCPERHPGHYSVDQETGYRNART